MRVHLGSGRVMWRLSEDSVPPGHGRMFAAAGNIFVPFDDRLLAIDAADGRVVWNREKNFRSPVAQMEMTPRGLLVAGSTNSGGSWRPYITLLDPATGKSIWSRDDGNYDGRSSFVLRGDTVIVGLKGALQLTHVSTGESLRLMRLPEFQDREEPCCVEVLSGGRILLRSSQNLQLVDSSGHVVHHTFLKAPGTSFLTKLAVIAVAVAASSVSQAAAPPGGSYTTFSPPAGILLARYRGTTNTERFAYIFTSHRDSTDQERFILVRVDKETGEKTGQVQVPDRASEFVVEPNAAIVVVKIDNRVLAAYKYGTRQATPAPSWR